MLTLPALYLIFYVFLRLSGVYESYYSQGSWEVDGSSNSYVVDVIYFPLFILETDLQFHFSWFHDEPVGC